MKLLERLFGVPTRQGENVVHPMEIPVASLQQGTTREISYERLVQCPECAGTGKRAGTRRCVKCDGTGRVAETKTVKIYLGREILDADPSIMESRHVRLRVAGEGNVGTRNGPPGDLYIPIHIIG